MAEGKQLYQKYNCVGCHANGGGGMGPALMDDRWIYGSAPGQVHASIAEGRPDGMPAFGGKLPDEKVWKIAAYVRSMSGLLRKDVSPSRDDHMTVRQLDGKSVIVMVDSKTKYTREKGNATVADLKAGVRVMVEAKQDPKMKMLLAEEVQVGVAETKPPQKK